MNEVHLTISPDQKQALRQIAIERSKKPPYKTWSWNNVARKAIEDLIIKGD